MPLPRLHIKRRRVSREVLEKKSRTLAPSPPTLLTWVGMVALALACLALYLLRG